MQRPFRTLSLKTLTLANANGDTRVLNAFKVFKVLKVFTMFKVFKVFKLFIIEISIMHCEAELTHIPRIYMHQALSTSMATITSKDQVLVDSKDEGQIEGILLGNSQMSVTYSTET